MRDNKVVIGMFSEADNAEDAINALSSAGYSAKDISLVMKDRGESERIAQSTGANVAGGAISGATTGGIIGGIAGLLVGIGAITVPGIGALLVGGPLAAALGLTGAAATTVSGAATGILAGGLIGALVNLGIPEKDARIYESRIKEGGILLAVPADFSRVEEVREILEEYGADQINAVTIGHANHQHATDVR